MNEHAAALAEPEREDQQDGMPAPASSTRSASFLVVPLVGVTSFAIFGQFATIYGFLDPVALVGLDDLTSWGWLRFVLAGGAAAVFESMALFVQYQAHAMLLLKATATAAKHRRISYGFAAGAALIQYWHFSDDWAPTPLAVMFAAFSAAGPWLWGLHTRHVKHLHLLREGQADSIGASFSAERWRAFPWRTWQARRWSIDFGVDDPRAAWEGFKAESLTRRVARANESDDPAAVEHVDEERPAPDVEHVDERGLSLLWSSAPPAAPKPQRAPAPPVARPGARRSRSTFLENPPPKAVELALQHGKDVLRRRVLEECDVEITEYEAKELIKQSRNNGQQVEAS